MVCRSWSSQSAAASCRSRPKLAVMEHSERSKRSKACMDDLGPELLANILRLGHFPPAELCQLSMLNRDWREAVKSRELWTAMSLSVPDYSLSLLKRLAESSQALTELRIARSAMHPRALTLIYCSEWLEGISEILLASSTTLQKLVVASGCTQYTREYRGAAFHRQFMELVSLYCGNLSECEVYYNIGRSGLRTDIPMWFHKLLSGCPRIRRFTLWTPAGDCGGLDNSCLTAACRSWQELEVLEVSGENMNLDGIMQLKLCTNLTRVRLNHITLGESGRSSSVRTVDDYLSALKQTSKQLTEMELANTGCDLLDLQIIRRQFPTLQSIRVFEYPELLPFDSLDDESPITPEEQANHISRLETLKSGCAEDDYLSFLVSFHDM